MRILIAGALGAIGRLLGRLRANQYEVFALTRSLDSAAASKEIGKAKAAKDVNPNLPPGLSELVMRAMAVDKTKRFQTMEELRLALESFRA